MANEPDLDLSETLPIVGDEPLADDELGSLYASAASNNALDSGPEDDSVWRVEDQEQADFAARIWARSDEKVKQLAVQRDLYLDEIEKAADVQRNKVAEWHRLEVAPHEHRVWFYGQTLKTYVGRVRAESEARAAITGRKSDITKSVRLPSATIGSRVKPAAATLAKDGADAVVKWLRTKGEPGLNAIRPAKPTAPTPDMAMVKRLVRITDDGKVVDPDSGEVIPGLAIIPAKETIEVKPSSEGV